MRTVFLSESGGKVKKSYNIIITVLKLVVDVCKTSSHLAMLDKVALGRLPKSETSIGNFISCDEELVIQVGDRV